jgi:hypothetical protein
MGQTPGDAFYEPRTREYRVPIREQEAFFEVLGRDGECPLETRERTATSSRMQFAAREIGKVAVRQVSSNALSPLAR